MCSHVYSAKGEILDHKTICHWGGGSYGTTYFARITPTGDPLTFRVEQATLDGDGKLLQQYKEDLIYTVAMNEYTISPEGKIADKPLGTKKGTSKAARSQQPHHKIVRTVQIVFREMR